MIRLILATIFLLLSPPIYATILDSNTISENHIDYPTREKLINIAVEKGVLPPKPTKEFLQRAVENNDIVPIWLIHTQKTQISLIDDLKAKILHLEGTIVKKPSVFYVDQLNLTLYNCLTDGDDTFSRKGIGYMFKILAILYGDFDTQDGRSHVQIMKNEFGEYFEWYKENYPEEFKALEKMDKEGK